MAISTQRNAAKAVVDALLADATFSTSVSSRIYAGQSPDDITLPLCRVDLVADVPNYYFGTNQDRSMTVQVTVASARESGVGANQALLQEALTALNQQSLTVTGWGEVEFWADDVGFPVLEGDAILSTITAELLVKE